MSITDYRAKAFGCKKILGVVGIKKVNDFWIWDLARDIFSIAASRAVGKDGVVYAFDVNGESIARLGKEMAEKP